MARRFKPIPFDAAPPPDGEAAPPPERLKAPKGRDIWVFGYGSLMWDPGFPFKRVVNARIHGYHRAFCIWSHHYRGTPAKPGLVLGLAPGGSCHGRAYCVSRTNAEAVIDYLYRREMLSNAYVPVWINGRAGRETFSVLTFVANRSHAQFAGSLPLAKAAGIIAKARGRRGPNRIYLEQTVRHLDDLGIKDGPLHDLLKRVENIK